MSATPPPLPPPSLPTPIRGADELCREAVQSYKCGDTTTAKRILAAAIERHPNSADICFNMAAILRSEEHKTLLAGRQDQPKELAQHMVEAWSAGTYDTLRFAERAHGLAPNDKVCSELLSEIWACLAKAHERCDDLGNAFCAYARSQEIAPSWNGKANPTEFDITDIFLKLLKMTRDEPPNGPEEAARRKQLADTIRQHAIFANGADRAYASLCINVANQPDASRN